MYSMFITISPEFQSLLRVYSIDSAVRSHIWGEWSLDYVINMSVSPRQAFPNPPTPKVESLSPPLLIVLHYYIPIPMECQCKMNSTPPAHVPSTAVAFRVYQPRLCLKSNYALLSHNKLRSLMSFCA